LCSRTHLATVHPSSMDVGNGNSGARRYSTFTTMHPTALYTYIHAYITGTSNRTDTSACNTQLGYSSLGQRGQVETCLFCSSSLHVVWLTRPPFWQKCSPFEGPIRPLQKRYMALYRPSHFTVLGHFLGQEFSWWCNGYLGGVGLVYANLTPCHSLSSYYLDV